MDVREFIAESEKLFIEDEASSRKYIIDRLAEQRKKLVALVNQLDDASLKEHFSVKPETVTGRVRRLYDALIGSVRLYLDGRFGESRERIFSAFFDNTKEEHNPLPSFSAPKGCNYFRIRENPAYSLYRREEIFHIPFERRSAVSNQRFSVSGYPCLYLGSSIYCCWEETNRPNVDTCNVVSMRNTRGLRFIDLSIPGLDEDGFSERSVYQLVLPLACSLRVSDPGVSFKAEYIIPQNVLSCIISRGGEEAGNPPFDGIIYTSNIYGRTECLFNDKRLLANYVLPILKSRESGLCENLTGSFELSEPTSMLMERLRKDKRLNRKATTGTATPAKDGDLTEDYGYGTGVWSPYPWTIWGETESQVKGRPHERIILKDPANKPE